MYAQEEKPAPKREPAKPAKDTAAPKPQSSSATIDMKQMPTQATVEMVLNEMVKNIAKRYNLNEEQRKKPTRS